VDWSTILTIAAWIFFVVMMMRGGGCCGMGSHRHTPTPADDEARNNRIPSRDSGLQRDEQRGTR
jgi:hypothetical protein